MNRDTLAALPDDIFLDIVEHLDSASDVAHLGATSRRASSLIEHDGWVPFVRRHFPSLTLPPVQPGHWRAVADRLTYLDKCWEKRAFVISEYLEKQPHASGPEAVSRQSVAPSTVVAASLLASGQKECVAWGSGENLVVQTSPFFSRHAHRKRKWRELKGASQGYRPGTGDVTALSIIDRQGLPQIAVGRADGSLQLQSLDHKNFGSQLQELDQPVTRSLRGQANGSLPSPGQTAVSWTEFNSRASLLATGQSSTVALYNLADTDSPTLVPIAHQNMTPADQTELSLVRGVKFMGADTIAVALGGSQTPLRLAKVTPDGLKFLETRPRHPRVSDTVLLHHGPDRSESRTVRAIEPVGGPERGDLLLSAWDDGTYRLEDIRTPSAYDAVYSNQLLPYEASSSLLVYGTERFVAGSNGRPYVCFVDFRQPKAYHWTSAVACSPEEPTPDSPNREARNGTSKHAQAICKPEDRLMCLWHSASMSDQYRPDAALMIGDSNYDRVHSLAKSSDASSSFWTGLRGGVFETRLTLAEDTKIQTVKSSAPPPGGWIARKPASKVVLVETGTGLRDAKDWSDSSLAINMADWDLKFRAGRVSKREKRGRLDPSVSRFKKRAGAEHEPTG